MKYQIISKESKKVFCDDAKDFINIFKMTFIREYSEIVENYEKIFPVNVNQSFMEMVTLQEIKQLHQCCSLKDVVTFVDNVNSKDQKGLKYCVAMLDDRDFYAFSYDFDKNIAFDLIEQITQKKIIEFNQCEKDFISFYAENQMIIRLVKPSKIG